MSEYLEKAGRRDVVEVFNHCKSLHGVYSHHKKGFTNDPGRSMRHVTSIPAWVIFDPEYRKYFDPQIPAEDRAKEIDRFIKRADWFDFRRA